MLFSFMGERHGRILLAHFDGSNLVVRKSELYRFIVKPQVPQAETSQSQATQSQTSQPEIMQPETTQAQTTQSHVSLPQTSQAQVSGSPTSQHQDLRSGDLQLPASQRVGSPIGGSDTSGSQPRSGSSSDSRTPESPTNETSLSRFPSRTAPLPPVAEDPNTQDLFAPGGSPQMSPHRGIAPVSSEPQSNEPLGRAYLDVDVLELFTRYLASGVDDLDNTEQLPGSSAA